MHLLEVIEVTDTCKLLIDRRNTTLSSLKCQVIESTIIIHSLHSLFLFTLLVMYRQLVPVCLYWIREYFHA